MTVGYAGTGTLSMSGGLVSVAGTLSKGAAGAITVNAGGTLQIGVGSTGGVLVSAARTLTVGRFGTLILHDGGTLQIGAGDTGGIVNDSALVFDRTNASTFSRVVSGSGGIAKQGAGALTLTGANTYAGVTTISGDGKTLAVLGAFMPGNSPGTVTVGTGFTLDLSLSGTSVFEITSPLYTPGTFDLVDGAGSVVFGGILSLDFSGGSYANGTDVLQLFANSGGRSGDFTSVVSSGLDAGQYAALNPATGSISIVPEPATWALALAGLAGTGCMLRRRRRDASRIPQASAGAGGQLAG